MTRITWRNLQPTVYVPLLAATIVAVGLVIDLLTVESLVVAIIYNVPIALSGMALSRRITVWTVLAALFANALAGFINLQAAGFDGIVVWNRIMAGLSFLLVGYLTLALYQASQRVTALMFEEARAQREYDLRASLAPLSGPLDVAALLERASREIRTLLQAEHVIISGFGNNRFQPPYVSDPPETSAPETSAPETSAGNQHQYLRSHLDNNDALLWAVAAVPTREPPVNRVWVAGQNITVGRWRRKDAADLLVLATQAHASYPEQRLAELLRVLEPLLERAALFEQMAAQHRVLEQRNNVIRDLVYAFSHDLRTPLIANALNMRHALEGAYGELRDDFKRMLHNGLSANEDLLELADALLLIARYESGDMPTDSEAVDIIALVQQVKEQLEPVWHAKNIHVQLDAPSGSLKLLGRPSELRRVIQNLLANAISYSPADSTIRLHVQRADEDSSAQGLQLTVSDEGSGIPTAQRPRLFRRFSNGRAGGGKGLGLYLARQIVEAHGGRISYQPLEVGSCFRVWLPIAQDLC